MSIAAEAAIRAGTLDDTIEAQLRALRLEPSNRLFTRIRTHLESVAEETTAWNDVRRNLRYQRDPSGKVGITFGPRIDKGDTSTHFHLDSGARLSFGIVVQDGKDYSTLLEYRFHLQTTGEASFPFIRFDLNPRRHHACLTEPRCHLHPGLKDVRLPMPVLHPLELLDRILLVIEPQLKQLR